MSKSNFKKDKGRLLRKSKELRAYNAKYGATPFVVKVNRSCGCCEAVLHFKDDAACKAAFQKHRMNSAATITDDAGDTVNDVDTFYGYRAGKEDIRGIGYLMGVLIGK